MSDAKYGRLFTEREVRGLIVSAYADGTMERANEGPTDYAGRLIDEMSRPTFPADEPLFLLRGQDIAARRTVEVYEDTARTYCASLEHLAAVNNVLSEMRKWQLANPGRVKVPD